jgi:hypothetical protein
LLFVFSTSDKPMAFRIWSTWRSRKYILAIHLEKIITHSRPCVAFLPPVYKSWILYSNVPTNWLHTFLSLPKWIIRHYLTAHASFL